MSGKDILRLNFFPDTEIGLWTWKTTLFENTKAVSLKLVEFIWEFGVLGIQDGINVISKGTFLTITMWNEICCDKFYFVKS